MNYHEYLTDWEIAADIEAEEARARLVKEADEQKYAKQPHQPGVNQ